MRLIIPMAGKGTRLRPHSHTTPKPLLPIAGISIAERIIDTFARTLDRKVTDVAFILGDSTDEIKHSLSEVAGRHGATSRFYKQDVAQGTAHAIYCADDALDGEIIVVFADTLFDTATKVTVDDADSVIWLKHVEDPSRFGVAVHQGETITSFVEKPTEPISKLAIIGVYYFKDGKRLKSHIQRLLDEDIRGHGGEFQLTDALDSLLKEGAVFKAATVDEWLDCGTIDAWLDTTHVILDKEQHAYPEFPNTTIIEPVYIGEGAKIEDSEIGPFASIGENAQVSRSKVVNSIVREHARVNESELNRSTVGAYVQVSNYSGTVHLGDHSRVE